MKKGFKKTGLIVLIGMLLLLVTGCGSKTNMVELADGYMKALREDPTMLTKSLGDPEDMVWKELNALIGEFEYELGEAEKEFENENGEREIDVPVKFTGYDVASALQEYLDNRETMRMDYITDKGVSFTNLRTASEAGIQELFQESDTQFFASVMEKCRNAGKTWNGEGKIAFVYLQDSKVWAVDLSHKDETLDVITNGLCSLLKGRK